MQDKAQPTQTLGKLTLPVTTVMYPFLNRADYKFDPDGVYRCELVYENEEAMKGVGAKLDEMLHKYAVSLGLDPRMVTPFRRMKDDGSFAIRVKQRAFTYKNEVVLLKPSFFDSKGVNIPFEHAPNLGSGSKLSLFVEVVGYNKPTQIMTETGMQTLVTCGLTLRPKGVQIISVSTGECATAAECGFQSVDGYTQDDDEQPFKQHVNENPFTGEQH